MLLTMSASECTRRAREAKEAKDKIGELGEYVSSPSKGPGEVLAGAAPFMDVKHNAVVTLEEANKLAPIIKARRDNINAAIDAVDGPSAPPRPTSEQVRLDNINHLTKVWEDNTGEFGDPEVANEAREGIQSNWDRINRQRILNGLPEIPRSRMAIPPKIKPTPPKPKPTPKPAPRRVQPRPEGHHHH